MHTGRQCGYVGRKGRGKVVTHAATSTTGLYTSDSVMNRYQFQITPNTAVSVLLYLFPLEADGSVTPEVLCLILPCSSDCR